MSERRGPAGARVDLVRHDEVVPSRWRNDGGWTRELLPGPLALRGPPVPWRVSAARIDASGPFSAFPGCDRVLVLASPTPSHPLALRLAGRTRRPRFGELVAFPGEAAVEAEVGRRGASVVNLVVRRGALDARVAVERSGHGWRRAPVPGGALVVVVLRGALRLGDGRRAGPLDAVVVTGGELVTSGRAVVAVIGTRS